MKRKTLWGVSAAVFLGLGTTGAHAGEPTPSGFARVREQAARLAEAPYRELQPLPRALRALSYDQTRDIRFDPKAALWRMEHLPFQLHMFHPGGLQPYQVRLNLVEGAHVQPVPFNSDWFDYGQVKLRKADTRDIGYAGFRVHYPLNRPDYLDELIVFLGASYFRALGKGQHYGLSARGLALNVAERQPEEFPRFTEFWVERPDSDATALRLYALLDSPSLTGAYAFRVIPGAETIVEINATLFPRRALERVGLAPLTSMFWYGKTSRDRAGDFRPEVHDSDGLQVHTHTGEWIWRPLVNDGSLRLAAFADESPRGFGLLQRERRFAAYEDLETCYHLRPSAWIEPIGAWGPGAIRLVEIPSGTEFDDNIVAFWEPTRALPPLQALEFAYRIRWLMDDQLLPPGGRCAATRWMDLPSNGTRRFVVDFEGPNLPRGDTPVQLKVSAGNGTVLHEYARFNEFTGGWRASFEVLPSDRTRSVELRCFLGVGADALTETWTYLWNP